MSQPSSESAEAPTVLTKRSQWNPYNAMLACALSAQVIALVFLLLEWFRYSSTKGPL